MPCCLQKETRPCVPIHITNRLDRLILVLSVPSLTDCKHLREVPVQLSRSILLLLLWLVLCHPCFGGTRIAGGATTSTDLQGAFRMHAREVPDKSVRCTGCSPCRACGAARAAFWRRARTRGRVRVGWLCTRRALEPAPCHPCFGGARSPGGAAIASDSLPLRFSPKRAWLLRLASRVVSQPAKLAGARSGALPLSGAAAARARAAAACDDRPRV